MPPNDFTLPDPGHLERGLASAFRRSGRGSEVALLSREANVYTSSFPTEIVTCRLNGIQEVRLFCKYGPVNGASAYGHRGGITYEIAVYEHLLRNVPQTTPQYFGSFTDAPAGEAWLILEYMDESVSVSKMDQRDALCLAARWLGEFHASSEALIPSASLAFLRRYTVEFYRGWAERTGLFAAHLHQRFPWLDILCAHAEEVAAILLEPPLTVIHGECTMENMLTWRGKIYPVDWETSAIAVGEIDLVSLTDSWPADIVGQCELAYQHARWPDGAPSEFPPRLDAARVYHALRWLGDRREWTTHEDNLYLFDELRSAGERMGVIG
jgi:hypothetical protein